MNTTGCKSGYATDEILNYENIPGACDMPVAGFLAWGILLVLIKLFVAIAHTRTWLNRRNKKSVVSKIRRRQQRRKFPIIPILSWLGFITFLLFVILVSTNAANTSNGGSVFLQGFAILMLNTVCLFFLTKFVSLGYRIAPKMKNLDSQMEETGRGIGQFDRFLKFNMTLCIISTVCSVGLFSILALALVDTNRSYIVRAGYAFESLFVFEVTVLDCYHVGRVKHAVNQSIRVIQGISSAAPSIELRQAKSVLTKYQKSIVIAAAPTVLFTALVASGLFAVYWYIVLLFYSLEVLVYVLLILAEIRMRAKPSNSSDTTPLADVSPTNL